MKNISKIVNSFSELKDVKIIKNIIFVSGKKNNTNNTNNTMITEQFEYKFEKVAKEVYKKLSWLIK